MLIFLAKVSTTPRRHVIFENVRGASAKRVVSDVTAVCVQLHKHVSNTALSLSLSLSPSGGLEFLRLEAFLFSMQLLYTTSKGKADSPCLSLSLSLSLRLVASIFLYSSYIQLV